MAALLAALATVVVCLACAVAFAGANPSRPAGPAASASAKTKAAASATTTAPGSAATTPDGVEGAPAVPADGSLYLGLDGDDTTVPAFDAETGISHPAVLGGYVAVGADFSGLLDEYAALPKTTPMISWKIDFTGGAVVDGKIDGYLRTQANEVRAFGKPVFIRPDWEMNGTWMPQWSLPAVTPAQYIAAWRHVVDIFRQQGVTNASFVWSPNANRYTNDPSSAWYPGDDYVDWIGLDGYPRVAAGDSLFVGVDGLDQMAQFAQSHGKPVMLAEWAATLPDPDSGWAFDLVFEWAQRFPDTVKALVYFDYGSAGNDHLLSDQPIGAAEFRYLVKYGPKILLTVPAK